jgi:DNA-binding beta-propeller fold protein YncE
LYDVSGANKTKPALKQVIQQTNAHVGLVWAPNSQTVYASGGCDDVVYAYSSNGGSFALSSKIPLGHAPGGCISNATNRTGLGLGVEPNVAGLAISADGKTLVAANNYNDSISMIDTASGTVRYEYDLRPFATSGAANGTKGGTFPYSVVLNGNIAYVGSDRDREVIAVDVSSMTGGSLVARIPLDGNANGMTLSADGSTLYVAQDNQDQVPVIHTANNKIIHKIDTRGPGYLGFPPHTTGAAPMAVAINPAKNSLYAVNAGSNSIAVIPVNGPHALHTVGLIPTAYDPTDVAFSADGSWMYIINGKSDTGPNPGYGYGNFAFIQYIIPPGGPLSGGNAAESAKLRANNQYQFQLEQATLVSAQVPGTETLWDLTSTVAADNGYKIEPSESDKEVMSFLHSKIKHVIYVVKENRTFDQILGDLGNQSNGDPSLTLFGELITPSFQSDGTQFRDPGQFHGSRRRVDGRLVLVDAWSCDQYGDNHAADQLCACEPGTLL